MAPMHGERIDHILDGWPHQAGSLQVRILDLGEPNAVVQVRMDMGLVQMALEGRPDGRKAGESETALAREQAHEEPLSAEACNALRDEANMYHQRAVALFAAEQFARASADCRHALDAAGLMRQRAAKGEDRHNAAGPIPGLIVLRVRADATAAVRARDPRGALAAIDAGMQELRRAFSDRGQVGQFERSAECAILRAMREMLVPKLPASQRAELEERLRAAVLSENYELAAILRNELRQIRE